MSCGGRFMVRSLLERNQPPRRSPSAPRCVWAEWMISKARHRRRNFKPKARMRTVACGLARQTAGTSGAAISDLRIKWWRFSRAGLPPSANEAPSTLAACRRCGPRSVSLVYRLAALAPDAVPIVPLGLIDGLAPLQLPAREVDAAGPNNCDLPAVSIDRH